MLTFWLIQGPFSTQSCLCATCSHVRRQVKTCHVKTTHKSDDIEDIAGASHMLHYSVLTALALSVIGLHAPPFRSSSIVCSGLCAHVSLLPQWEVWKSKIPPEFVRLSQCLGGLRHMVSMAVEFFLPSDDQGWLCFFLNFFIGRWIIKTPSASPVYTLRQDSFPSLLTFSF